MNVGFNTFFKKEVATRFIVKNVANNKTIKLFNYPITPGNSRDLLAIPEVSEADIRHSLLKGELRVKAVAKEIKVSYSNIDLLQFDNEQRQFLLELGILDGLNIDPSDIEEIGKYKEFKYEEGQLKEVEFYIDSNKGNMVLHKEFIYDEGLLIRLIETNQLGEQITTEFSYEDGVLQNIEVV